MLWVESFDLIESSVDTILNISKGKYYAKMVNIKKDKYFLTLRNKMGWAGNLR